MEIVESLLKKKKSFLRLFPTLKRSNVCSFFFLLLAEGGEPASLAFSTRRGITRRRAQSKEPMALVYYSPSTLFDSEPNQAGAATGNSQSHIDTLVDSSKSEKGLSANKSYNDDSIIVGLYSAPHDDTLYAPTPSWREEGIKKK